MKWLALINPLNVTEKEAATYSLRNAVRAVVFDENDRIALLHVTRDGYHKLPGGGVESGEDKETALRRECREEIGCDIEVLGEIGYTQEYFQEDSENQTSFCYLARLVGPKGESNLSDSERERGFETVWLPYDDALHVLRESTPTQWEGKYIVPREIIFLEEARKLV
jgi:ADP-ribose pyrophosphatase YjhB (NUDIX family)